MVQLRTGVSSRWLRIRRRRGVGPISQARDCCSMSWGLSFRGGRDGAIVHWSLTSGALDSATR
jgi:hypothetical protein